MRVLIGSQVDFEFPPNLQYHFPSEKHRLHKIILSEKNLVEFFAMMQFLRASG